MTRDQYHFSNIYWEDPEWSFDEYGIPKEVIIDEDGETYHFNYLSTEEVKEFIKIKMEEEPEMKNDIRLKKLNRIDEKI